MLLRFQKPERRSRREAKPCPDLLLRLNNKDGGIKTTSFQCELHSIQSAAGDAYIR